MHRWLYLPIVVVLGLLMFAGVQRARQVKGRGISPEAYVQLELGMTLEEAERILGCPPGDYRTGPSSDLVVGVGQIRPPRKLVGGLSDVYPDYHWENDSYYLGIYCQEGKLTGTEIVSRSERPGITTWDRIRWYFGYRD